MDHWGKRMLKTIVNFRGATLMLIIGLISVIMAFASPAFLTVMNIKTTMIGLSAEGIVVIGMTVALVSGGVDLSVGSVFCLAGVVTGKLYLIGTNVWLSVLGGLVAGLLCGLFVGLLVGKGGINPLITSLAMMGIARGLAMVITSGSPLSLYRMPEQFTQLGEGTLFGVPIFIIFFVGLTVIGDFLFRRSGLFRKVFYTGSNEKAAILSGINTDNIKVGVYVLSAILPTIAGLLTIARFRVATPSIGVGMELACISAAVIGGASLTGGEGTILGSVLGIVLLALIRNALVLRNVSIFWQQLVAGVILIIAVSIDHFTQQRKKAKVGGGR